MVLGEPRVHDLVDPFRPEEEPTVADAGVVPQLVLEPVTVLMGDQLAELVLELVGNLPLPLDELVHPVQLVEIGVRGDDEPGRLAGGTRPGIDGAVQLAGRKVLYSWIGGTRRDWRGQGHFRALTEESEAWAHSSGFHEVVVKTKNRFYDMRGTLDQLEFNVVKYEPNRTDNRESKVYLSKLLSSDVVRAHTSTRTVVYAD